MNDCQRCKGQTLFPDKMICMCCEAQMQTRITTQAKTIESLTMDLDESIEQCARLMTENEALRQGRLI